MIEDANEGHFMKEKTKNITGIVLFLIFIAFIILGIIREENRTVLMKAVNICLECIGIG